MLNLTSLILAATLLPAKFAILRIAGGIVVALGLTYVVSIAASRWSAQEPRDSDKWLVKASSKVLHSYSRLFRFEDLVPGEPPSSASSLISMWLNTAWRLAGVMVPVLLVGAVVASAVVSVLPAATNNVLGVIVASAFGTLIMIPTWTELAIALPLIQQGLDGPAAALLLTLPAVSIPCLLIIGGALNNQRVAFLLGILVFLVGIVVGLAFL